LITHVELIDSLIPNFYYPKSRENAVESVTEMHDDRTGGNTELQFLSFRLVVSLLSRSAILAESNTFASSYCQLGMLDSSGTRPEGVKLGNAAVYRRGRKTLTSTGLHIDSSIYRDRLSIVDPTSDYCPVNIDG